MMEAYTPTNAQKYLWLADTIQRGCRMTFDEINERWLSNQTLSGGNEILKRTFHKWIKQVKKMLGVEIECERRGGYHYFIKDEGELENGGMARWLLESASVQSVLLESLPLRSRILLETVPSGESHLTTVLGAMRHNHPLTIAFQSFWHEHPYTFVIHPYALKMFKQRWYLLGYSPDYDMVRIYGLDRILEVVPHADEQFKLPSDFDAATFFRDYYGVCLSDCKAQLVRLRVSADQAPYLRTLPLHTSQKEVETTDDYSIFTYWLSPEFDFVQALLAMGEDVEVLSPADLRQTMARHAQALAELYSKV